MDVEDVKAVEAMEVAVTNLVIINATNVVNKDIFHVNVENVLNVARKATSPIYALANLMVAVVLRLMIYATYAVNKNISPVNVTNV